MQRATANRWWLVAGLLAAAAVGSVVTRAPDPPREEEAKPDARFRPLPRPPPLRAIPPGPTVADWTHAERPEPGVEWVDLAEGVGPALFPGHIALLEITSWRGDGALFESTFEQDAPVRWPIEPGAPVGLSPALVGMRPGGVRLVWLEPDAGFGGSGVPGRIPPGVGLQVEVELLEAWAPPTRIPATLGDERVGAGAPWDPARAATVDYTLWSTADPDRPIDSSSTRWYPHRVTPGAPLPALFERALSGLRVGGRRVVRGAASEAFGPGDRAPLAPAGADVVLQVELRSVP